MWNFQYSFLTQTELTYLWHSLGSVSSGPCGQQLYITCNLSLIVSHLGVVYEHITGGIISLGPSVLFIPIKAVKTPLKYHIRMMNHYFLQIYLGPQATASWHLSLFVSPQGPLQVIVFCGHCSDVKRWFQLFPAYSSKLNTLMCQSDLINDKIKLTRNILYIQV